MTTPIRTERHDDVLVIISNNPPVNALGAAVRQGLEAAIKDGVADGRTVQLCSLLPMAAPALAREDGSVWLGLQVQHGFGDPSRDIAAVLLKALEAEPGEGVVGLTVDAGH